MQEEQEVSSIPAKQKGHEKFDTPASYPCWSQVQESTRDNIKTAISYRPVSKHPGEGMQQLFDH